MRPDQLPPRYQAIEGLFYVYVYDNEKRTDVARCSDIGDAVLIARLLNEAAGR